MATTYYPLFINGEAYETSRRKKIFNPSDASEVAEYAVADVKAADAALEAARQAFDHGPWRGLSTGERRGYLRAIAQGILDQAGELAQLETRNTGKPIKESTFMDIPSAARVFDEYAQRFPEYLKNESVDIKTEIASARSTLRREPLGVAVLIVPWNYPLLIACWKLAQALAAGNTVVLKPSSVTPLTALALAGILRDARLPKGVVNIVAGSGESIGHLLCSDRRVDMISFTGSNEAGKQIIGLGAAHVRKTLMELGGKSCGIVFKDADFELAVNGSLCSAFLNQGQMCTAMSRILVQEDMYDRFVAEFVERTKRLKIGEASSYETQMGPLISQEHRQRVLEYIDRGRMSGARLEYGGGIIASGALERGNFLAPAVFTSVPCDSVLWNEEIFGPVVCINKFSNSIEAIEIANRSEFGLACSLWSGNVEFAEEIAGRMNAGTVWINSYGMFYNEVPYGGFKQSGFGKELGKEGLLEYTRLKNILTDRSANERPLIHYWYGF
jgi:betaine-aldehyde dehydrogenase